MSLPLRIMTRDFQLINEVNLYSSLQITRSWHGIGYLELRINRYLPGANELTKGRIIFPHNKQNKAFVIKHREIELDASGKASENWIIRALPLKSWTSQRITYPPSTTAYDNKQDNAESVMQHFITNNIINPVDDNRRMDDIILAVNQIRGNTIGWQSRYKNLAEEVAEISLLSGLGWNIEIDVEIEKYVFKVMESQFISQSIDTTTCYF